MPQPFAPPLATDNRQLTILPARRPINLRSVSLGLLGTIAISALTPYNDWAVNNTYLVGNYLPIGLLLFLLTFIILINGFLHRFLPRQAFSTGELAVATCMLMVACAVPGSGLMRYLPTGLIGVLYQPGVNPDYLRVIRQLNLPEWMFPTMSSTDWLARANDPVVQNFWGRAPAGDGVPWSAWLTPAIAWGLFFAAFAGAIFCIAVIVRRQWVENERLPFPIAQIYLSVLEPPEKGRMHNALFRSRGFWIAAGCVFAIHLFNGLNQYDPKHWPKIPITYDLTRILVDAPFNYMEPPTGAIADVMGFKRNTLYFSIIGISFFLQTRTAFSLWFFYFLFQLERVGYGLFQSDVSYGMQQDQQVGGLIPFALAMLWVGRHHWAMIFRQMFGRRRQRDPRGHYLPYPVAGWALIFFICVMIAWLKLAGATLIGAIVLVILILMIMTVVARVIAETGLLFVQIGFPYWRPWVLALTSPLNFRTTATTYFHHGLFSMVLGHDVRETLSVFATHALRVADETVKDEDVKHQDMKHEEGKAARSSCFMSSCFTFCQRFGFIAVLILALATSFLVSGASMLRTEYAHAVTMDATQTQPLGPWATEAGIKSYIYTPTQMYLPPNKGPVENHSRWVHFFGAFSLVTILSIGRLSFSWWPLHPVGFLIAYGYPIKNIWFSLLVGWLIKLLIVRFGGTDLFRAARNIFIGLIIGEATAAGFWLIVSLVLANSGMDYKAIRVFPN